MHQHTMITVYSLFLKLCHQLPLKISQKQEIQKGRSRKVENQTLLLKQITIRNSEGTHPYICAFQVSWTFLGEIVFKKYVKFDKINQIYSIFELPQHARKKLLQLCSSVIRTSRARQVRISSEMFYMSTIVKHRRLFKKYISRNIASTKVIDT